LQYLPFVIDSEVSYMPNLLVHWWWKCQNAGLLFRLHIRRFV